MIGPNDDVYMALVETDERGQTVRLPAGVRISADRVRVRREGERVILEPDASSRTEVPPNVHPDWPPGFWEEFDRLPPVSDAFVAAVEEVRAGPEAWCATRDSVIAPPSGDLTFSPDRTACHGGNS